MIFQDTRSQINRKHISNSCQIYSYTDQIRADNGTCEGRVQRRREGDALFARKGTLSLLHVQGETVSKGYVTISSVKTSISTDMAYKTQNDTHKRIPGTTVNIETYKYSLHWRQSWKVRHYKETAHHTPTSRT